MHPTRAVSLVTPLALLSACQGDGKADVNTAPIVSSVEITADADPATPSATLACTATASDPDGDALTTDIAWSLESDGAALGTGETLALAPDLVAPDDVVVCTATVTDPDGATAAGADSLQLGNADPVLSDVAVSADTADGRVYNDSTVACTATATDPDERGVELAYGWRNETTGEELGTDAVLALTPELATPGDGLVCTVVATDADAGTGTDNASVTVENRGPAVGELTVTPAAVTSQDTVSCAADAPSDPDEDGVGVAYAWQRDGADAGAGDSLAGPHGVGEVLTCIATVTDDHGAETVGAIDVTVDNTAPTVDGVTVTPTEARVGETLTCAATASDVDGETPSLTYTWTDGTTGDTHTVAETDDPGDTLTCTATATDGALATAEGSAVATVLNTDPVVATVGISPASANNDDTLTCTATATDADGDAPALTYAWSGSAAGSLGTGSTVDLSTTAVASLETVTCTVTAADPDGGSAGGSADLAVANRDPSVTVSLSPATGATRSDILTCTATAGDDDGDAVVVSYGWTVDGVAQTASSATATSSQLAGVFTRGQGVTCTATADDAKGGTATSSATTTIANTPPDISAPSLAPGTVYTNDTLTANVATSDDDGDGVGVTYAWFVDGTLVQDGADNTLSGAVHFDKDDAVHVVATADDGTDTSTAMSGAVTVSNTPPTAPTIAITPADPSSGEELVCEVVTAGTDVDGDPVSYTMSWTVDSAAYSSATTTTWTDDTVDGADVLADETWICTATPDDGDDDGAVGVDSVTVQPDTCAFTFASTASELSINPTGFGIGRSDFTLEMWIHAGTTTGAGTATVFRTNATPLNDPATVMHALVDTTDSTEVPYRAFLSLRDNWCEEPNEGYQAWIPRDGDWHHVATVRSGDRLLTFLDGVQTTNHSLAFSGTTPPLSNDGVAYMGALGMNPAPAGLSIGPMRFVSSAVYTSTFTPATDWTVDSDTIGQWNTTSCFDGSTLPDETGDNDGTGAVDLTATAGPG